MNPILGVIIFAISPLFELRGAIPYGIASNLDPLLVFSLSVSVNIAMIPVIFLILHFFFDKIFEIPFLGAAAKKAIDRAHRKAGKYLDTYGLIGLALFVAIPLPITGAYTGCLVASVLEMERYKAGAAIAIGVFIAGILVTLASMGILSFIKYMLLI